MKLILLSVLAAARLAISVIGRYQEAPLPRRLENTLNQVNTDLNSFVRTNPDGSLTDNAFQQLADSPDQARNDGRVQLMSNYDLQFTDDIRVIIQNVLLYRKNFNQAKSLYQLMNQKSYYWGSNYEGESKDPRSGRPINLLLANNEIGPVPRKLNDAGFDSSSLSMHDHTKQTLLSMMDEKEYENSGFDAVARRFNPNSMYSLKNKDSVLDDLFEKSTKNRKRV